MEFYPCGDPNAFSLHDMIECDLKRDFSDKLDDDFDTASPFDSVMVTSPMAIDHGLSLMSPGYSDCGATGMVSPTDILTSDHHNKDAMQWLQTVNLSLVQNLPQHSPVSQSHVKPENCDPNLLVNPQTGLPVILDDNYSDGVTVKLTPATLSELQKNKNVTVSQPITTVTPHQVHQAAQPAPVSVNTVRLVTTSNGNFTVTTTSQPVLQTQAAPLQSIRNAAPTVTSRATQQVFHQRPIELTAQLLHTSNNNIKHRERLRESFEAKSYPKPVYSYSCLIAMALKNSDTGALPVSEIYNFMTENFPYFKTAPDGWKNSVRHNLSLNKCFEKIENPKANGNSRKGCLWGLNPVKVDKMDDEILKWRKKDTAAIKRSMSRPEVLEQLEKGNVGSQSPNHPNNINLRGPLTPTQSSPIIRHHLDQVTSGNQIVNGTLTVIPAQSIASLSDRDLIQSLGHYTSGSGSICSIGAGAHGNSKIIKNEDVHVDLIEIKPADSKTSRVVVKSDEQNGGAIGGVTYIKSEDGASAMNMSGDELLLEQGFDPALLSVDLQNGLWEELGAEGINLDDMNMLTAGLSSASSSPLTVQSNGKCIPGTTSPLVSLLTSNAAAAAYVPTPNAGLSISRTIFAQN